MGGGLESRCVGRVYGADGAVYGTICTRRCKHLPRFVSQNKQLNRVLDKFGVRTRTAGYNIKGIKIFTVHFN